MSNRTDNLLKFSSRSMPILTYFGKSEQRYGWEHSGRIARTNIMVLITSGSAIFSVNGQDYDICEGGFFFVVSGEFYKIFTPSVCEYYFAHFTTDLTINEEEKRDVFAYVRSPYAVPPPQEFVYLPRSQTFNAVTFAEISSIFAQISVQKQRSSLHLSLTLSTLFFRALLTISNTLGENILVPSKIRTILDYINNNVTKNISLASVCENFKLSKQYVCRLFKEHLNSSVNDVILSHKMANACEYLDFSTLTITELAEKLGFDNIYYFSRKFKEFYGISPSEYRKRR